MTITSAATRSTSDARVAAFDGVRGFAILLVVMGHTLTCFGSYNHGEPHWLEAIVGNATFGVQLFFVLSGYLITSLLIKERNRTGVVSVRRFYARRLLRICPAFYAFMIAIALLAYSSAIRVSPGQFLLAALYAKNYQGFIAMDNPKEGSWFLGHIWTLSLEEQFYLIWPLIFVLVRQNRLCYILPMAIGFFPAARVATYFLLPAQRGMVGMMFHTAADSIVVGCLCALLRTQIVAFLDRHVMISRRIPWLITVPLLISPILSATYHGAYAITVGMTVNALCAGMVILTLHEGRAGLLVGRLCETAALQLLGRLSYSLYLWQQLFLNPFQLSWTLWWPLAIGASVSTAVVSYWAIELPILRLKSRFCATEARQASLGGTIMMGAAQPTDVEAAEASPA